MKKLVVLFSLIALSVAGKAQLNPVSWTFSSKKTGDKTYEISMTATMQSNWHIYAQEQPDGAEVIPTSFTINANPLLTADGKIQEVGKLEKYTDKELNVTLHQYSNTVTFVQKVKLKANVKTNFTGTLEYQTCNEEKMLPTVQRLAELLGQLHEHF